MDLVRSARVQKSAMHLVVFRCEASVCFYHATSTSTLGPFSNVKFSIGMGPMVLWGAGGVWGEALTKPAGEDCVHFWTLLTV